MNTHLTERIAQVIGASGETCEPIFRTPCSVGSGEVEMPNYRTLDDQGNVEVHISELLQLVALANANCPKKEQP